MATSALGGNLGQLLCWSGWHDSEDLVRSPCVEVDRHCTVRYGELVRRDCSRFHTFAYTRSPERARASIASFSFFAFASFSAKCAILFARRAALDASLCGHAPGPARQCLLCLQRSRTQWTSSPRYTSLADAIRPQMLRQAALHPRERPRRFVEARR